MAKVFELAGLMPERLRALVLLATFASLRWGEVAALRRLDLDLTARTVSVRPQHVELDTGELLLGPPKSRAGVRTIAIPEAIIPALRDHLDQFTDPEPDALIFTESRGGILPAATSGARPSGARAQGRSVFQACISTTSDTPVTRSPPVPARASKISCSGWDTTPSVPR
ncbi:hypothetical protein [Nonomuraea jiangxiensis]|uniref:hypothetical protein n=1 Tax=Nonomuraea jiangxiensis TaxID=633440 RepID=UPI000ACA227E|nr:hypothetical protein [Nonomuraea jiangxiensis]